jgi:acyl-coenzyme A synthetase/AMP-(fatty) acid ligase
MLEKFLRILKFVFYSFLTLRRDVTCLYKLAMVKRKIVRLDKNPVAVSQVFRNWVKKQPNKECIVFDDKTWTFLDVINFENFSGRIKTKNYYLLKIKMENYGNKIANLFSETFHLKRGDCIALMMENKPEHVGIWYGMSKIGVTTALINTNLRSKVLLHSIEVAKPKLVIYDEELEQGIYFSLVKM